ncbi:MAG: tetratricopeptide repeat protein [Flavobacteriaceae bacterium]|nr:tetratricopeptide repeat protein [Flavobacteriaceae bacterium]
MSSVFSQNQLEQAIDLYKEGRYAKALPIFQKQLSKQKEDALILEYIGDIMGYTKRYDEAIQIFEELVTRYPNNANYHFKLGGTLGIKALGLSKIRAVTYISDI